MIFKWREDVRFAGDAQVIGEHLQGLANGEGRLTPHVVIGDAINPASPLHNYFEWNDSAAAEKYRVWQAQHLIAAIAVVRDEVSEPVRAFINIRTEDDQSYRALDAVLSDKELRKRMLHAALNELNSIKKRYRQLRELDEVFSAAAKVQVSQGNAALGLEGEASAR